MTICVQGDHDAGVPQPLGDDFRMHAASEEQAGVRMTEIVEADARTARELKQAFEGPANVAREDGRADAACEDEIGLAVVGS